MLRLVRLLWGDVVKGDVVSLWGGCNVDPLGDVTSEDAMSSSWNFQKN